MLSYIIVYLGETSYLEERKKDVFIFVLKSSDRKKRYVFAILYLHMPCCLIVLRIMVLTILKPFESKTVYFILGYPPYFMSR